MFIIVLTPCSEFLSTLRALAREFSSQCFIDASPVQELELQAGTTWQDALDLISTYERSGCYERVELQYRS